MEGVSIVMRGGPRGERGREEEERGAWLEQKVEMWMEEWGCQPWGCEEG